MGWSHVHLIERFQTPDVLEAEVPGSLTPQKQVQIQEVHVFLAK